MFLGPVLMLGVALFAVGRAGVVVRRGQPGGVPDGGRPGGLPDRDLVLAGERPADEGQPRADRHRVLGGLGGARRGGGDRPDALGRRDPGWRGAFRPGERVHLRGERPRRPVRGGGGARRMLLASAKSLAGPARRARGAAADRRRAPAVRLGDGRGRRAGRRRGVDRDRPPAAAAGGAGGAGGRRASRCSPRAATATGSRPCERFATSSQQSGTADSTLFTRVDSYEAAWETIEGSPLIGVGLAREAPRHGDRVGRAQHVPGHVVPGRVASASLGLVLARGRGAGDGMAGGGRGARSPEERRLAAALFAAVLAFLVFGQARRSSSSATGGSRWRCSPRSAPSSAAREVATAPERREAGPIAVPVTSCVSPMRVVLLRPAIGDYRRPVLEILAERLGGGLDGLRGRRGLRADLADDERPRRPAPVRSRNRYLLRAAPAVAARLPAGGAGRRRGRARAQSADALLVGR